MTVIPSKYTVPAKSSSTPCFSGGAGNGAASGEKQIPLDFYAGPPEPGDRFFMAFTFDHDEEGAAAVFLRRYGRPPEFVFESRGNLLVGPIPTEVLL